MDTNRLRTLNDILEMQKLIEEINVLTGDDYSDVLLDAAAEIERLKAELAIGLAERNLAYHEIGRLRQIIIDAPHAPDCNRFLVEHLPPTRYIECNCWKREALRDGDKTGE